MSENTLTESLETQDNIIKPCTVCGKESIFAYWDEELEYYMYSSSPLICVDCHNK